MRWPSMQFAKCVLAALATTLSGCLATPGTSALSSSPTPGAKTTQTAFPERLESLTSVLGLPAFQGPATKPIVTAKTAAEMFDLQKAELDLMRPDGSACKAVSDGGFASNFALMTQVGVTLTFAKYSESSNKSMNGLQLSLNAIRPQLKQLSKQVIWLPVEAENVIGNEMIRMANYRDWQPTNKSQRAFVDGPLKQSFNELKAFSNGELKSPLNFQMRLIRDDNSRSAEMLPGGTLIIPSGLVSTLAGQEDADQTLAFILAHEFSHALRRHTTKSIQGRLVDGLMIAEVFNKQFKGTMAQLSSLNSSNLSQLFNLSAQGVGQIIGGVCTTEKWFTAFDQTQELEADTCGALLLDKLGANVNQAFNPVSGFNRYRVLNSGAGKPAVGVTGMAAGLCVQRATHPTVEVREQNLQRYWATMQDGKRRGAAQGKGPNGGGAPGLVGRPD